MKFSRGVVSAAAAIFIAALVPSAAASATTATTATTTSWSCWNYKAAERNFFRLTNRARRRAGAVPLRLDSQISKVARRHTWAMVGTNRLYHTSNGTLARRVTNWTQLGENVGVGGAVDSLQSAFMNSPEHRANILYNHFHYVGIGVVKRNGRMWVTVEFEARSDPGTRLSAPTC